MSLGRVPMSGVVVREVGALPDKLEGGTRVGPYSCARPGALLRVVPGVGRFLARDGAVIEYALEAGADPGAAEALVHGGLLGGLIHQRGELPLHASALIAPDGARAVALAGHSGVGKSTTAHELVRRGWALLADDLTRVTFEAQAPVAWPGRTRLRLMSDACVRFGIDPSTLAPAPNWPGKYQLDVPAREGPVRLSALLVLERSDDSLRLDRLKGAAAASSLIEHTFRRHYVAALGCSERHLDLVAAAALRVAVWRLGGSFCVGEAADAAAAALSQCD
jgi:hypothetical protein